MTRDFRFPLGILLVVAVTIAAGVVHGKISYRWGPNPRIIAAKQKLEAIPKEIGEWTSTDEAMEEQAAAILQPFGYVLREYTNQRTKHSVRLMVLLGQVGATAVHTPEVCMGMQAYQVEAPTEQVKMPGAGPNNEFHRALFREKSLAARRSEVFYAWRVGDHWSAPKDARLEFVGNPYLYKLQVSGPRVAGAKPSDGPCYQFLRAFLPKAEEALVAPNAKQP
jgi:hypothetical protein